MKTIVIAALAGIMIGFVFSSLYQSDIENFEAPEATQNTQADKMIDEVSENLEKKSDSLIQDYEQQIASLMDEVSNLRKDLTVAYEKDVTAKPFRELKEEVFTSKKINGLDVSLESGKIRLRKNGGAPLVEIDTESQVVSFHDGILVESEGKVFLNEAEIAGDLISGNSREKAQLKFKNETSDDLYLFWVDSNNKPKFYGTIEPGGSHDRPTYMTHQWVLLDTNGNRVDTLEARYPGESEDIIYNESP